MVVLLACREKISWETWRKKYIGTKVPEYSVLRNFLVFPFSGEEATEPDIFVGRNYKRHRIWDYLR